MLLYGMSLLYGLSGTLALGELSVRVRYSPEKWPRSRRYCRP